MMEVFDLPSGSDANVQLFTRPSISADEWQTWVSPRGAIMLMIICVGGGGGGAAGDVGGSFGGSGGAGSQVVRTIMPAFLLPQTLYVRVGAGGRGGTSASRPGQTGGASMVAVFPNTDTSNLIITTSTSGGGTTSASPPQGGVGGSASSSSPVGGVGIHSDTSVSGDTGANAGQDVSLVVTAGAAATQPRCFGAPGGGSYTLPSTVRAGGRYTAVADTWMNEQIAQVAPTAVAGRSGGGGVTSIKPFFSMGGMPGHSNTAGVGGAGGRGGIGAGGAGGGSGSTVGGSGGDGGDGMVMIIAW